MPLVSSKELLQDAFQNHYAVGAFPCHNLEMVKAILTAAEELNSPVILQTTPGTIEYLGIGYIACMVKEAANQFKVPVSLHLDHGDSFRIVNQCLRGGYTSIMIDGSKLGFEENVELTKKVVEVCRNVNVPVEAEIGTIGGGEDDKDATEKDDYLTDPELAEEFVARTGIDFLAPAFGTAHGLYNYEPDLDFKRLRDISRRVKIPIVMHGASGISDVNLQKAIEYGVSKVNFSSELKKEFAYELRAFLNQNIGLDDPRQYFLTARESVRQIVKEKIKILQMSRSVV